MKAFLLAIGFLIAIPYSGKAQNYNPTLSFPQELLPPGNNYRSAKGNPGQDYWQNKADYQIKATFDTLSKELQASVNITYYNNSPDELDYLWLALDQNADRDEEKNARSSQPSVNPSPEDHKGFNLHSVSALEQDHWQTLDYRVEGTRLQIFLKHPLAAKNGKLQLKIDYDFQLQEHSAKGRAGMLQDPDGSVFEFAYWYPRLCVYDDLRGWNTLPYLGGGEFYCDFGNIDYRITVPAGLLVVGSGELQNAKEILEPQILNRMERAKASDSTIIMRSLEEVRKGFLTKKKTGPVTWHFRMNQTRDVAFAVSKAFIWDGAKANLPDGKTAFAQSVYPPSSLASPNGWPRATEYLKASLEIFSEMWYPYPYPEAVNVAGAVGGMEFPALTFDWAHPTPDKDQIFWMIISHEIGHTWYPMIVGANERRYPFMDEGFNVFIDIYAQERFNRGEYAPKRDGEYAPGGGNPSDELVPILKEMHGSYTLMHAPDHMTYDKVHPLFYFKAAHGLVLLREVILGPERFDYGFKTFTREWAFKHPSPVDFFRTMNNTSGEDLSWFWQEWFYQSWLLDQSIQEVSYPDNDPKKGAIIRIENKEQMVFPLFVEVTDQNGELYSFHFPVDIWSKGAVWQFEVPTKVPLLKVEIDPQHLLPQVDRSHNVWLASQVAPRN